MIDYRSDWGKINILLDDYLVSHKISKSKLSKIADLQYTQLQSYCKNEIQRPDLDVLSRICFALECSISDILEYVPPKSN